MKKLIADLLILVIFISLMVMTILSGFDAYDRELQIQETKIENHFEMIIN